MRIIITIITLLIILNNVQAQKAFRRNTAYAELLGNGPVLSVNYELQTCNKPGWGIHAGIGLGGYKPAIPLGVIYLVNLGKQKSFLETGLGVTLAEEDVWSTKQVNTDANPYQPAFIPSVGYRHHTPYGLMWKFIYSPFFHKKRSEWKFFGASVGWRF